MTNEQLKKENLPLYTLAEIEAERQGGYNKNYRFGFNWSKSRQGENYWYDVNKNICTTVPPEYLTEVSMRMYNNTVIKVESVEHGKKVIEWWNSKGIDTGTYEGKDVGYYYGLVNGSFLGILIFHSYNLKVITLPAETMLIDEVEQTDTPLQKGIYQHYKGGKYELLFIGTGESDLKPVAIYKEISTGKIWDRPLSEFKEKFKFIEVKKDGEFVWGEEVEVSDIKNKMYYVSLNPKVYGYSICVDQAGSLYNCFNDRIRKIRTKIILTKQQIADKFGIDVKNLEIN